MRNLKYFVVSFISCFNSFKIEDIFSTNFKAKSRFIDLCSWMDFFSLFVLTISIIYFRTINFQCF